MTANTYKILIAEGDKANRQLITELLSPECQLILANDAEKALARAETHQPDLILLDLQLPGGRGYNLLAQFRKSPFLHHVPIIFLGTPPSEREEELGLSLGAVDYIAKPLHTTIVRTRINNHLQMIKQRRQLEGLRVKDSLTGIYNRRHFDQTLASEWRRALRTGTPLAIAMIDVDCFALYNDEFGHNAGDNALRLIARSLSQCVNRAADVCARFGGEEFVLLLPDTPAHKLPKVCETCRQAVDALNLPHPQSSVGDRLTVSLGGAACIPADTISDAALLAQANERLFLAKRSGRNQSICSPSTRSTRL
mgnify:CR=1 FL=1